MPISLHMTLAPFAAPAWILNALTGLAGIACGLGTSHLFRRDHPPYHTLEAGMHALFSRHVPAIAWSVDQNLRIVHTTGSEGMLLGFHFQGQEGAAIGALVEAHHRLAFEQQHEAVLSGEIRSFEGLYFERYYRIALEPARDRHGTIIGVHGVALDISEAYALQNQLARERHIDALTGLVTRMRLYDRLAQALLICARNQKSVGVLAIDIDRFKALNDLCGREVGDQLLRAVAERLRSLLRKADTVARLGNDDFAAVLLNIDTAENGATVAGKVITAFQQPFLILGEQIFATVSVGIAISPFDGEDETILLRNALTALSYAKISGGNTYHFYTNSLHETLSARMTLESALRIAIENHEIVPHYQPLVSREGLVVGYEALARWEHSVLGRIPPARFIPIAEENGSITALGSQILLQACHDIQRLQAEIGRRLRVAVNISARQFDEPLFVESIIAIIQSSGVDPTCLELELTESMLMRDMEGAIHTLSRIKATGVSIAIDDFGTGYSSLSHLKRLPVDTLKIDQSFVRELPEDKDDEAIVTAIVSLAHALNMHVVAEGIETPAQLEALLKIDCDLLQGFFFGRPISLEQTLATYKDLLIYSTPAEILERQAH
jgi:diguanylate cyclase (GGDEF)-like protein